MSVRRAQDERIEGTPDGFTAISEIMDVADTPTIGAATNVGTSRAYNNGAATVAFTAAATGGTPTSYTVTSSPGSFTGTGASSPVTVTGLASQTSYTFTATATSAGGTSAASSASGSITATTVPQAPTIGTATDLGTGTTVSVTFTPGATGGSAITGYTVTSSPGSITATGSSPVTVSGLTAGTAYTFTVTATNANGTSAASSASNSVTPITPSSFDSIATITSSGVNTITFSSIPQTYTHLQLRIYAKTSAASDSLINLSSINGDTSNNYTYHVAGGTTSSVSVGGNGTGSGNRMFVRTYGGSNIGGVSIIDIYDYASTTKYKTLRSFGGFDSNGDGRVDNQSMMWTNTAAITSLTFTDPNYNIASGSRYALYGVK